MTTPVLRGSAAPLPGRPDGTPYGQNTLQATSPDSTLVGDLVLCVSWHGTPSATGSAFTLRSGEGWTQLFNFFHDDGSSDGCFAAAWKIATLAGAQVYQAFNDTGGFQWADCRTALRIYSVGTFDSSGILSASPVSFIDGNVAPDPGNISGLNSARDYLIEAIGGWWHNQDLVNCTPGAPTGYINLIETSAAGWLELALANKAVSGVTSENPGVFTDNVDGTNTNGSVGGTIAILGAAGIARQAIITQAELEVPEAPPQRRTVITQAEVEIPNKKFPENLTYIFNRSWNRYKFQSEDPQPVETRRALITQAELEVPDLGRRAIVTWNEVEIPNPIPSLSLGVYSIDGVNNFTNWLGRSPDYYTLWLGSANWSDLYNYGFSPTLLSWLAANQSRFINMAIPMTVGPKTAPLATLQQVAGGYAPAEAAYRNMATFLINQLGNRPHVLRMGWEVDGDWFPWRCRSSNGLVSGGGGTVPIAVNVNYFGAAFRKIREWVDDEQPTNQFVWEICVTTYFGLGFSSSLDFLNLIWPGDAYCDQVNLDTYDQYASGYPIPSGASQATIDSRRNQAWTDIQNRINVARDFAIAHGKTLAFGEWGCSITTLVNGATNPLFGNGGGDNPGFIQRMYDYFNNPGNQVVQHSYLDNDPGGVWVRITPPTQLPNAAAKYNDLFGV